MLMMRREVQCCAICWCVVQCRKISRRSASRPAGGRSTSRARGSSAYLSNESLSAKEIAERVTYYGLVSPHHSLPGRSHATAFNLPLSIVWTVQQQQQEEERLEVHVNNEKIFSCDHLRALCDGCDGNGWKMRGGRGRCGVLCTAASSLIVKDCQCRPLPNSSSSSSSSSSCVVLPVVTCNSSRGEPSQTA
eukprot:scaffold7211_cov247-Ochromonas_danica.AAC.20